VLLNELTVGIVLAVLDESDVTVPEVVLDELVLLVLAEDVEIEVTTELVEELTEVVVVDETTTGAIIVTFPVQISLELFPS
jgi:signal recognition particle GTPase